MDFQVCVQCGREIEDKGILFRNRHFCSDECCEEFEELYQQKGEPDPKELEVEEDEVVVEDLEDLENMNLDDTGDSDDLDDLDIDIEDF